MNGRELPGYFERDSPELTHYTGWLGERLSAIKVAATGEPLIANISVVDRDLPGARREFLPDLILQLAPAAPVHRIHSPDIGEIKVSLSTGRGGNHNDSAFLFAMGSEAFLRAVDAVDDIAHLGSIADSFPHSRVIDCGVKSASIAVPPD